MKRLIILLTLIFTGLTVQASENMLHTIVVEGTDDGYNIVLKSDSVPEVRKITKGNSTLILDVKGIEASNSVNALYKGAANINSLIVEHASDNELKIYIQAEDISRAAIMAQTENGNTIILSERFPVEKLMWSLTVLLILGFIIKSAKALTEYENSLVIKKDIKSREIELYKSFQRELQNMPAINCKIKNAYATNAMPRSRRNYKELARL